MAMCGGAALFCYVVFRVVRLQFDVPYVGFRIVAVVYVALECVGVCCGAALWCVV